MNNHITVVSCGLAREDMSPGHVQAVEKADVIAGAQRLLDWFPSCTAKKIALQSGLRETLRQLAAETERQKVAILASGDALFFGIGRVLMEELPTDRLTILPNLTAAQEALARLKIPWGGGTRFFSVHGRDEVLPWRRILQAAPAVVYCDPKQHPAAICEKLMHMWPPAAPMTSAVAENLKTPEERVVTGTVRDLAESNFGGHSVLIIHGQDHSATTNNAPPFRWVSRVRHTRMSGA